MATNLGDDSGWRPLSRPARPAPSLGASPFARLAAAHALSAAGDALVTMALAGSLFFDISPTAARGKVALSLVLTMAPFGVVAPFLGPAIDRTSGGRRIMVVGAAVARAVACLVMAAVIDSLLLFPAAFGLLVFSKAHAVSKSALVPTVVDSDDVLVEANAKLALISVVMGFLAAIPGVAILELAGGEWVLRLAAVVFVAAAVASVRIRQVRRDVGGPEAAAEAELHDPRIVLAATTMAVLRAIVGFLAFLVAFSFRRTGAPSWWFGVVLAASMVGSFGGNVLAPRLRGLVREEAMLAGAHAAVLVGGLAATQLGERPAAALLALVVGLAAATGRLAFEALVQRDAPDAAQGRSFARFEAAFQLVWVVGALIPVLLSFPMEVGLFVIAVGAGLAGLSYALSGRRLGASPHARGT